MTAEKRTIGGLSIATLVVATFLSGCGGTTGSGGSTGTGGGVGNDGQNTLVNDPLSFDGQLSGKVADSQSTRASLDATSSGQDVPPSFDVSTTCVTFHDLAGAVLLDANGTPFACVPLNADGSFSVENLPVGTDFTICIDIGSDGTCDIESCVQIPTIANADSGELTDVQADPLTTAVLAKIREIVEELGIDPEDLPFSPASVVTRVVTAYTNLYEETGVEDSVTLEEIESLTGQELAAFFEEAIPPTARTGVDMVEGNLAVVKAEDVNAVAAAVAEVFLRAGFPIMDRPGGPDLSYLADLSDVEVKTPQEFFVQAGGPGGPPPGEHLEGVPPDGIEGLEGLEGLLPEDLPDGVLDSIISNIPVSPAQFGGTGTFDSGERIYFSTVAEPDRNQPTTSEDSGDTSEEGRPHLPVINDFILVEMAKLHVANQIITLGDVYDLLTSFDDGLGARLTFTLFNPQFFGPPLNVFETADGKGKAVSLDRIFARFFAAGLAGLDPEQVGDRQAELRQILEELLGDTIPPAFERVLDAVLTEHLGSVDELAQRIRDARSHLPFSLSGPSTFFVVADGDPFQSETVSAITVDADVDAKGHVSSVSLNSSGSGKFYLGFTERTDQTGVIQLIVRDTGRPLHSPRGPVRLSMFDDTVFHGDGTSSFSDLVSETGTFYPGASISVVRTDFVPEGDASSDGGEGGVASGGGPNQQLFVLSSANGPDGTPVHVDYDLTTGVATFNEGGRHLLMFLPDSQSTGIFGLFNADTGRPAMAEDPAKLFAPPMDTPAGFEDFFNQGEDLSDFSSVDDLVSEVTGEPVEIVPEDTVSTAGFGGAVDEHGVILVDASAIQNLTIAPETFTRIFGTEVPNPRYDADRDPYFDDVNGDGVQSSDEPTAPFRPALFNPEDWRSTDIRYYYRRSDNNASVSFEDVAFESETPKTKDGVDLVARSYLARLNAFRFGRPNTAINLLTAFAPADLFNGTNALNEHTPLNVFSAIAFVNLVMDQVFDLEADVDLDGLGPQPRALQRIDAHIFLAPISDPFVLFVKGFGNRSTTGTSSSTVDSLNDPSGDDVTGSADSSTTDTTGTGDSSSADASGTTDSSSADGTVTSTSDESTTTSTDGTSSDGSTTTETTEQP